MTGVEKAKTEWLGKLKNASTAIGLASLLASLLSLIHITVLIKTFVASSEVVEEHLLEMSILFTSFVLIRLFFTKWLLDDTSTLNMKVDVAKAKLIIKREKQKAPHKQLKKNVPHK